MHDHPPSPPIVPYRTFSHLQHSSLTRVKIWGQQVAAVLVGAFSGEGDLFEAVYEAAPACDGPESGAGGMAHLGLLGQRARWKKAPKAAHLANMCRWQTTLILVPGHLFWKLYGLQRTNLLRPLLLDT